MKDWELSAEQRCAIHDINAALAACRECGLTFVLDCHSGVAEAIDVRDMGSEGAWSDERERCELSIALHIWYGSLDPNERGLTAATSKGLKQIAKN